MISFTLVYVASQHPRRSSQDKDAKSKFSDIPFNFIELLWHSEIYLCQEDYSYGAKNIILVQAEAIYGKLLLLLLLSPVPAPANSWSLVIQK